MSSEPVPATGSVLSPRAGLAMLTLQLRSALQEATAAEAAEGSLDEQAAREELRDRLTPLLAERRAQLEHELTAVREAAAAKVAAARRAAEVMLAKASAAKPAPQTEPHHEPPVESVVEPSAQESLVPLGDLMASFAPSDEREPSPTVAAIAPAEAVTPSPTLLVPLMPAAPAMSDLSTLPAVAQTPSGPVNIGIDSEAFARVFAAVFATMLDERLAGTPLVPSQQVAPWMVPPPPPAKKGFWASALHVDVALLGAAMVIMLVVLAAWLA